MDDLTLGATCGESVEMEDGSVDASAVLAFEALTLQTAAEFDFYRELTFLDLPHEVFVKITSYLDIKTVVMLSQVCKQFMNWLHDEMYWRARLMRRWPIQFPALEGETVDWREACYKRESLHQYWSDWSKNMHKVEIRAGLSQCVDALHIKSDSNLLLIGGRDRFLSIYDTKRLCNLNGENTKSALLFEESRSHKGWIWCIRARENYVITAAWDMRLRFWAFQDSQLALEREIKLHSSVLSATFLESTNCAAASTFDKLIEVVDKRQEVPICMTLKGHQRAVLRVITLSDPNYLVSASEDKKLAVWDFRNPSAPYLQYKFSEPNFGFPRCLAHHMQSQLWVGDSRGLLHLFRVTPETLTLEHSYELSCVAHLIGVHIQGQGLLATASQREYVRIWHPTQPPLQICHLEVNSSNQDLASMDFNERELTVGAGNGVVSYWSAKSDD